MTERCIALPATDRAIVEEILRAHVSDRPVYVFGSRSTGRSRRVSDLDLAIGGPALSLREQAILEFAFEESLLPMMVDVVSIEKATGVFRSRMLRECLPLNDLAVNVYAEAA